MLLFWGLCLRYFLLDFVFCDEFKVFLCLLWEGCENFSWSSNELVIIFKEFIFMRVFVIDGVSMMFVEGSRVLVVRGSFIWIKRI